MGNSAGQSDATAASRSSLAIYDDSAKQIAALYEMTTFEQVHAGTLDLFPPVGASVLDIGAGSGRDAAALAKRGYCVTAVEPSRGLREEARDRHGNVTIEWIDDALPDLRSLGTRQFSFVLMSAVWMHIAPHDRSTAMRRLAQLVEPHGHLSISLRQGPADTSRAIAAVAASDVEAVAASSGLRLVRRIETADTLGRAELTWSTLILEKPGR